MPDEKVNEPFHWKNKLDELAHVPGEPPVDKGVAWRKLHDRLQKKPPDKNAGWYWVAAACLLGMLALSWLMRMQPDNMAVINDGPQKPASSTRLLPLAGSKEKMPVSPQPVTDKKPVLSAEQKNKSYPASANTGPASHPVVLNRDTVKEPVPAITIDQPVDTVSLMAAVPVKKKLRVVHINELSGTTEKMQLASSTSSPASRKLLQEENASGFSFSRNASDNILKIKLSSSN